MTIHRIDTESYKGNEFIAASCSRCFRKGQMVFRIRIDNPTEAQIERVWYKANKHDGRKADHTITLMINHRVR